MSKRKLVIDVENKLMMLDMETSALDKYEAEFIDRYYSGALAAVEKARMPLQELGMYDQIKQVVNQADALRKDGRYEAAGQLLYATYRELMRRSGTDARNARKYRGLTAEQAAAVPYDSAEDFLDALEPDQYQGSFQSLASDHERQQVLAVENGLSQLRLAALTSKGEPQRYLPASDKMREQILAAQPILAELGLHRSLLEALTEAEALVGAGKHFEADEEIRLAAEALADRSGLSAARAKMLGAKRAVRH